MTMTVELGALEPVVQELVANGRFGSKSEVLRAGVRLVQEREARLAKLLAEIQVGVDSADRGELYDLDEAQAFLEERRASRSAA